MRELRSDFDTAMAQRRHRALPLQRLRALPQDEWNESTSSQTATSHGKEGVATRPPRCRSPSLSMDERFEKQSFAWKFGKSRDLRLASLLHLSRYCKSRSSCSRRSFNEDTSTRLNEALNLNGRSIFEFAEATSFANH